MASVTLMAALVFMKLSAAQAQSVNGANTQEIPVSQGVSLCAAAARGTWEQIETYVTQTLRLAIETPFNTVVCEVGNRAIGETLDGTMLHMAVHRNTLALEVTEGVTRSLLGTISEPLDDATKRAVFVAMVSGANSHTNIFDQFRINHREESGKRQMFEFTVQRLCRVISSFEIDELYSLQQEECGKTPWNFFH